MVVHLCVYVSEWDCVFWEMAIVCVLSVCGCICMFVVYETVCVLVWLSCN